jgi:sec-independent protein translocase protein TatC
MLEDIKPHIAELRSRLIKIVLIYLVFFVIAFIFWKDIFQWMSAPLLEALKYEKDSKIIFTGLAEPFFYGCKNIAICRIFLFTAVYSLSDLGFYSTWAL